MPADVETDTVAEPGYISTGHLPTPDAVTASESRIPDVGYLARRRPAFQIDERWVSHPLESAAFP
jgi:hypothetical protein